MFRVSRSALILLMFALSACNVSDPEGSTPTPEPECRVAADCDDGEDCVSGECVAVDIDMNTSSDMGTNDMSTPDDMGEDDLGTDMTDPMCPEGRVDLNGDPADGCEIPDFPAAHDAACEPCWDLPDALAGCVEGQCVVLLCLNDKADTNGDATDGCEADCGPGECWDTVVSAQSEWTRVDDDFIMGNGSVLAVSRDGGEGLVWLHPDGPGSFVGDVTHGRVVLDDHRIAGIRNGTIAISDDLGASYRDAELPVAFGANGVGTAFDGTGLAAGYTGTCASRQCPAEACRNDETCVAGVCEGSDCTYDSDCPNAYSVCTAGKCVDPGNLVCVSNTECAYADCNFVGYRMLASPDFETWTTSGAQVTWQMRSVYASGAADVVVAGSTDEWYRTVDRGANWTPVTDLDCDINEIRWNSVDRVVAVGDQCIKVSSDDGVTFADASIPGNAPEFFVVRWLDDTTLIAAGNGVIARSVDAGLNWTRTDITGVVNGIIEQSDGALIAMTRYLGRWTSDDGGQNWTETAVDQNPLPTDISVGSIGVAGISSANDRLMIPPAMSLDGPWTLNAEPVVQIDQQANDAMIASLQAVAFTDDFQAAQTFEPIILSNLFLNNQVINGQSCGGRNSCTALQMTQVLGAAYNGTTTFVSGTVLVRVEIDLPIGPPLIQVVPQVMVLESTNQGADWAVSGLLQVTDMVATPQGFIGPDRYYTGNSVRAIDEDRCDNGPFFVRADGAVLSFEGPEICESTDGGATWGILATRPNVTDRVGGIENALQAATDVLYATVTRGREHFVIVTDDGGMNWQDTGVVLPEGTNLDGSTTMRAGVANGTLVIRER